MHVAQTMYIALVTCQSRGSGPAYTSLGKLEIDCEGNLSTVEPVYNGHLGTRYIWPLYTGGCFRGNLYKVVSSILVVMAVINE